MQLWLTEDQVIDLTRKRRPSAQLRVLSAMGYSVVFRPDGSFIVPIEQFLPEAPREGDYQLDFSGLGNGSEAA